MPDALPEFQSDAQKLPSSVNSEERHSIPTIIVDKSPLFRVGLQHVLAESQFHVTASYSSMSDIPEEMSGDEAGLLLIGLSEETPESFQQLALLAEQTLVVVLADHSEDLLAALGAGAVGYFIKNEISSECLIKSLDLALHGEVIISRSLLKSQEPIKLRVRDVPTAQRQLEEIVNNVSPDGMRKLTNREQTMMRLLMRGLSNKEIAREACIAEATVKVHVKGLYRKLRVKNRTQAALLAKDYVQPSEKSNVDEPPPQPPPVKLVKVAKKPDLDEQVFVEVDYKQGFG